MITRTALYIRVSTDRQAKEGDSLEAQENALVEYTKKNNMIIVDKYIDGGESGQKLNRTSLTRLLEDVKQNKIDLIIMTKLDRWFRSVADFYKVIEILSNHKVKWKTIWEDYDTTTASGEFWLNMSLSLGRMEAKRTGERINSVFDFKYKVQKTVCTGSVPYGYKISEGKKIVIDEEKAEHIRQLYNYYIKTNNLSQTVRWFQENINKRTYEMIRTYLKNPAYIGKYKITKTGEILDDYIPPIIEEKVFNNVQTIFKRNIKSRKNINYEPFIFSGLLKCAACGKTLKGKYGSDREKRYYICKSANLDIYCNNKRSIPEKKIEKYLFDNILTLLDQKKVVIEKMENQNKEKINTIAIKKKMERLVELYVNEMIDIFYYKDEYEKLNALIKKEEIKQSPLKTDFSKIKKIFDEKFTEIYKTLNREEKRKIWRSIIDYIEIKDREIVSVNFMS